MTDTHIMQRPSRGQAARELLKLAFPLILSNLFWTLQLTIDRVFLSQYSSDAVAACLGAVMLFYTPFILLQTTVAIATTFVAQYYGAGRPERIGAVINHALYFCLVAGIAFLGLWPIAEPVMAWVGHSPQIQVLEVAYFQTLCFSALPMFIVAAVTAFFAGRGDSWTVLWYYAAGMVTNAVLDYLWIFGYGGFPEMGIAGAGWATVAGSYVSALVALALMWRPALRREYQLWASWRVERNLVGRLLWNGVPSGLQAAIDCSIWTGFALMLGWLGDAELAASSIIFAINASFLVPMLGMGQAVSVTVGQRLGEDRPDLAEQSAWIGALMAAAFMVVVALLLALAPELFLFLFASRQNPEQWAAVARIVPTLLYFVAAYTFFDSMNIMITFALRGAGDTRFVTVLTFVLGFVMMVMPTYYASTNGWGIYWCWGIAACYLMVQCAAFTARFLWGPWRSMRVIEQTPLEEELMADRPSVSRSPEREREALELSS